MLLAAFTAAHGPYRPSKTPRCHDDSQPFAEAIENIAISFLHGSPTNFEQGQSYLTDRIQAENARMIFSRGWPCLRTT